MMTPEQEKGVEYRKTATIRAIQYLGQQVPGVCTGGQHCLSRGAPDNSTPHIHTLEGDLTVSHGDWIATGVKGEHWAIKPDVFVASYEPVSAQPTTGRSDIEWLTNHFNKQEWPGASVGRQAADRILAALSQLDGCSRPTPRPASQHGDYHGMAYALRTGLEAMANRAVIPMELWDTFSNDVLAAADILALLHDKQDGGTDALQLIAQGWTVIESDGQVITIQAPDYCTTPEIEQ